MRVVSSLADIDFGVGRITRAGGNLLIESSDDSTIATRVTVTAEDARRSLWTLATSPSAWRFLATLPFKGRVGQPPRDEGSAWEQRRRRIGLNKPW